MAETIKFKKRARRDTTATARRRIWDDLDRSYRIIETVSLLGLPTIYYAMLRDRAHGGWSIISRHRKRSRAIRACNSHLAHQ